MRYINSLLLTLLTTTRGESNRTAMVLQHIM